MPRQLELIDAARIHDPTHGHRALCSGSVAIRSAAAADPALLNVSYDPTRELYRDINRAFVAAWQERPGSASPSASRMAARARRRARCSMDCRPTSSRWRWPPISTRSPNGGLLAGGLAEAAAGQRLALHQHHRVPGAQGQSEGHPATGPIWSSRASRSSRRTRRPPAARAGTSSPPGPGRSASRAPRPRRPRPSCARCSTTCRCWTPARAAPPTASPSAASATCCWPGRTRPGWRARNSAPTSSRSSIPSLSILAEPPVAVVDSVVDKKGTREVAEAYLRLPLHAGSPGRSPRKQLLPPARPGGGGAVRRALSRR